MIRNSSGLKPSATFIFINIFKVFNCKYLLYTVYLKLFYIIDYCYDHRIIQNNTSSVCSQAQNNQTPVNTEKTMILLFSRKTNTSFFECRILGNPIMIVVEIKDKEVLLVRQIEMVSKTRRNLGHMKWIERNFRDIFPCVTLYKALVLSQVAYATVV